MPHNPHSSSLFCCPCLFSADYWIISSVPSYIQMRCGWFHEGSRFHFTTGNVSKSTSFGWFPFKALRWIREWGGSSTANTYVRIFKRPAGSKQAYYNLNPNFILENIKLLPRLEFCWPIFRLVWCFSVLIRVRLEYFPCNLFENLKYIC